MVDLLKSRGGEHIQVFGGAAASLSGQAQTQAYGGGASSAKGLSAHGLSRHDQRSW
jgi:hypothetical protein